MHRVLAIVVGIAVLGSAGHLSRLHTHGYADHAHPEHRHGLASHEHDDAAPELATHEERPHVESCTPGRHTASFTLGFAAALTTVALHADVSEAPCMAPPLTVTVAAEVTDLRVHGPPATRLLPSRAPPPHVPA